MDRLTIHPSKSMTLNLHMLVSKVDTLHIEVDQAADQDTNRRRREEQQQEQEEDHQEKEGKINNAFMFFYKTYLFCFDIGHEDTRHRTSRCQSAMATTGATTITTATTTHTASTSAATE